MFRNLSFLVFISVSFCCFILSCNEEKPTSTDAPNSTFEELSFFEKEAVGKWSRYHAYDGSRDYLILKLDRTACKWEEPSSGGRKNESSYTYWDLDEDNPIGNNRFKIFKGKSKSDRYTTGDEFHYNEDEIWQGGYNNLVMGRSTTSKDCQ